jgi:hypothetical protein
LIMPSSFCQKDWQGVWPAPMCRPCSGSSGDQSRHQQWSCTRLCFGTFDPVKNHPMCCTCNCIEFSG